jgi:hypothetical protein
MTFRDPERADSVVSLLYRVEPVVASERSPGCLSSRGSM